MEDIKLIYPGYEIICLINHFNNNISIDNNNGKFYINNDILNIVLDNSEKNDFFLKKEKIYEDELDIYIYSYSKYNNILKDGDVNGDVNVDVNGDLNITFNNNLAKNNNISENNDKVIVIHDNWNDTLILNKDNMTLYRKSNNEIGNYILKNNLLIIDWINWNNETFLNINDTYYYLNKLYIYHTDWNENCIIDKDILYRSTNKNEYGNIIFEENKLTILWNNWPKDLFYKLENDYYYYRFIVELLYKDEKYLINKYNNFIFKKIDYTILGILNNSDETYILDITWNNGTNEKYSYIIENEIYIMNDLTDLTDFTDLTNIKLTNNYSKMDKIILFKDFEEEALLFTDGKISLNNKNGIYKINDNKILDIYWDDLNYAESYVKNSDFIYYYKEYVDINNSLYILIDNSNKEHIYTIHYFKNYIESAHNKYKFIYNDKVFYIFMNDSIQKYYLYNIFYDNDCFNNNKILLHSDIYEYIKDENINFNIYKCLNNICDIDNYQLFIQFIKNKDYIDKIYSIQIFLKKYYFFNMCGYMKNNFLESYEEAIIHWYSNGLSTLYFYSDNNIEIIYDNLLNSECNHKYMLYIINLENDKDLKNVFDSIPRNAHIILNYRYNNSNFNKNMYKYYEQYIIQNYKNLIITKSNNMESSDIIKYIYKNIISVNNKYKKYNKVTIINNYFNEIENKIKELCDYDEDNNIGFDEDYEITCYDIVSVIIYKYILYKYLVSFLSKNINIVLNKSILDILNISFYL